jgi:DNA-binding HxlR family transcriptional regulator|uniref:winged helix-turn-helix transcriptional regulator n=1 Tax=Algoriphagus sp. TaxID=1872435 RepID=UPI0040485562
MNKTDFRSPCPLSSSLELIGDKWSLIIVRDLLMGKKTYSDFLSSPENIASNVLITRLKTLKEYGIIDLKKDKDRKNVKYYFLTEMGMGLLPVMAELALWYEKYVYAEPDPLSQHLTNIIENS